MIILYFDLQPQFKCMNYFIYTSHRTTSEFAMPRAGNPSFWHQNRILVHIFHFLPTSLVFEIVNPFTWIFNAISSDKSCLTSTWRQDTRIFPACWILIGQFKFPARQPYATGRKKAGRWNGQSALGPMCDAEKDWHECSLRVSGAINGCQKSPLDEPEMKFSFFIFKPRATY